MSSFGLRATLGIATGIAAGASLACEPRVSVGDNSDHTDLGMTIVPKASDNPKSMIQGHDCKVQLG